MWLNIHLSGEWDSHPRPSPWQGDVLLLNYRRIYYLYIVPKPALKLNLPDMVLILTVSF